ncbi:MAG TPA: protein jag [Spirochaetaceae bacterium]|nr:protein jag [Spirochaetaceae bacterium]
MVYEFEGRTEEEAIEIAAAELGLARDEFDVEIVESLRGGFLKKGKTVIKVHTRDLKASQRDSREGREPRETREPREPRAPRPQGEAVPRKLVAGLEPDGDFELKLLDFVREVVERMGYGCKASVLFREEQKLGIRIESESAAILIGKKGKNLDALQLLANVYAGKLGREDLRVIIDSENYRIRREESIVKMAYEVAEKVRRTRASVLLEPMNPFERRIVHTTLNDIVDIETKSEGEGLYKQVRVMFRGKK